MSGFKLHSTEHGIAGENDIPASEKGCTVRGADFFHWSSMKYLILGVYLLMCSACAPIPHFITVTPDVSGTVTYNGVPLSGVSVLITPERNYNSCSMAARTSITDAAGDFELKRARKFMFFSTMGDYFFTLKVCIIKDGNMYIGYTDEGSGYPPESIRLKCIINMDSKFVDKNTSKADFDKFAVCTIDK
jgi:hypothetical protein